MDLKVLQSQGVNAVNCPHRQWQYCVKAWQILGTPVVVTPPVCQFTCRQNFGPYEGRENDPNTEAADHVVDLDYWATKMLAYSNANSVQKVRRRYGFQPFNVVVPAVAELVREAFEPIRSQEWFKGLGLSGSIIHEGSTPKDLDVVLVVSDLREWNKFDSQHKLRERVPDLKAVQHLPRLPKVIGGMNVDLFARESFESVFATLDLDKMQLHINGLYRLGTVPPDVTVVPNSHDFYTDSVPVERPRPTPPAERAKASAVPVAKGCNGCSRAAKLRQSHSSAAPAGIGPE